MLHDPHIEKDLARRVGVAYPYQGPGRVYGDAKFFAQLPRETRQTLFARLQLPAGELPTARQVLARRPLGDQHTARAVRHRRGDHVNERSGNIPAQRVRTQPLACCKAPWQCLYLRPDPQGQASFRPTLAIGRRNGAAGGALERGSISMTLPPEFGGSPPPPESPNPGAAWIGEMASACCACSARASRCCRSSSSRSISAWLRTWIFGTVVPESNLIRSSIAGNNSNPSRLYSCFGFFCA